MARGKTIEALDDLILRLMQAESVDFDTAVKIVKGMIASRLWAIEESKKNN